MFAIEVTSSFSAAHALRLPNGQVEPLHGHDFHVTVKLAADQLDAIETVIDFHEIEAALDLVLAPWRNNNLNTLEPFETKVNPSAERIAERIGRMLMPAIADLNEPPTRNVRLVEVRITEAPNCLAIWMP